MLVKLGFDWPQLQVALEGTSHLDLPKLNIRDRQDAIRFVEAYGFQMSDPQSREEIWRIYFESLSFIENHLLMPGESIPDAYKSRGQHSDILKLIMDAGGALQGPPEARRWACSILRVMHAIAQLDHDIRSEFFHMARTQVFDRFDRCITPQKESKSWLVGEGKDAVSLVRYFKKEKKSRPSMIVKLLSKADSLVENIYDGIGLRFITETKFDAIRLIHKFFELGLIVPSNVQAGRSINTLIPFESFREEISKLKDELEEGKISLAEVKKQLARLEEEYSFVSIRNTRNPFSSRWYRSIHFTCRQLVTVPDPAFVFWKNLEGQLSKNKTVQSALKKIPIMLRERRSFYYPYEVQIMDKASYVESIGGRSRHREYKSRQKLMARNRVLRDLI